MQPLTGGTERSEIAEGIKRIISWQQLLVSQKNKTRLVESGFGFLDADAL